MITKTRYVDATTVREATGWDVKPEGACRGEVCVPLPAGTLTDDTVDLVRLADRLGMAIVDGPSGMMAIGPATFGGHALATATAPDLTLTQLDGTPFALSSLRGRKAVIVSWAPY